MTRLTYRVVTIRPSGRPAYATHDRRHAFRLARNAALLTGRPVAVYLAYKGKRLRIVRRFDPAESGKPRRSRLQPGRTHGLDLRA